MVNLVLGEVELAQWFAGRLVERIARGRDLAIVQDRAEFDRIAQSDRGDVVVVVTAPERLGGEGPSFEVRRWVAQGGRIGADLVLAGSCGFAAVPRWLSELALWHELRAWGPFVVVRTGYMDDRPTLRLCWRGGGW